DLGPGEPPGAIRGAGPSGARQRAAVGRREDHQRLVLGQRLLPRFGDIGKPGNLTPRTLAALRLDVGKKALEVSGADFRYAVSTRLRRDHAPRQEGGCENFPNHEVLLHTAKAQLLRTLRKSQ